MSIGKFVNKKLCGHVLDILRFLPDGVVDLIVTSPPYWGLRDYGKETNVIWDGKADCEHEWRHAASEHDNLRYRGNKASVRSNKNSEIHKGKKQSGGQFCSRCGAWYGQLGLEPTLELYISHLLQITAELKRVLKKTGVCFWNHGDCYGGSWQNYGTREGGQRQKNSETFKRGDNPISFPVTAHITPKCLAMQNYRLILKMIDEQGWILRNDIKWYKRNHMPSSAKDRFTNVYEPVFFFSKSKKYWFDLDAVRIPVKDIRDNERHAPFNYKVREAKKGHDGIVGVKATEEEKARHDEKGRPRGPAYKGKWKDNQGYMNKLQQRTNDRRASGIPHDLALSHPAGKNPGDVWLIATQPFPEAHFATFPEKLIAPMIKAGCPAEICKKCGKARERITEKGELINPDNMQNIQKNERDAEEEGWNREAGFSPNCYRETKTIGWTDCECKDSFEPGIVLDPFGGRGTVAIVARNLGRRYIYIDIQPEYVAMAEKATAQRLMEF